MKKIKSERWNQIDQIYNSAVNLEPGKREAFVKQACAGDESLRTEVERLLEHQQEAENFIEAPAIELLGKEIAADSKPSKEPSSLVGEKVVHYRILSLISQGGMGKVYRARDTRLGREVALKTLPSEFASDAGRRCSF